ncbi:anti-sigma factor antagonist [Streptomyces sp. WAC05374]|uniref:STAS domain-containing protein n=1 Tax=Streptomyces sp. WAC05374 TaxID=2487420 RepID=UPI000F895931|nr:STAS domain-containing protein [Streptomyces sp. WAC05374]RST15919.1 anti-sigma factor antagonist [Streptomyces sp. WAC05374]TDF54545.1 anti-sigma factor antagonist [Streptomyces sp. WAC05374]TDF56180.1 anti-sigma factor antagonist [Streptomyces sp. WAC05374]
MPEDFTTTVTARPGGDTMISVSGELDIVTGEELRDRLHTALNQSATVLIDLSHVTFLDCSGVRVLLWARRQAAATGVRLLLHDPSPAVGRILRATRLDTAFTVSAAPVG